MCALFGISGHAEASRLAYFALYAQQHRGQESAGITTFDGSRLHVHAGMGLVPDVFDENTLQRLAGDKAIGHVRYSTTGTSSLRNAQPLLVKVRGVEIALAHNGNLTNAAELRAELEDDGAIFQSDSDSEIFIHLIARNLKGHSLEDAVKASCGRVRGAYALVILSEGRLIALRDPHGFRPLALGRVDNAWVVASETCALDLLEADYVRDIDPGEMLIIDDDRLNSRQLDGAGEVPVRQCIFELVYFARPDSLVFGEEVYSCRKRMGLELAKEGPSDAQLAIPFPDSGIYATIGYAQGSGIPYEHAFIRNHYVGRTFIQPTQGMRNFGVRVKLNPVHSVINGKHICVVDDSIVRGTTMRTRVGKMREYGAKVVDVRISCPPVRHPCYYGVDFSSPKELVAANYPEQDLPHVLNLDSLHYLSIEGLLRTVRHPDRYCLACFDGNYPVPVTNAEQRAACACHAKA